MMLRSRIKHMGEELLPSHTKTVESSDNSTKKPDNRQPTRRRLDRNNETMPTPSTGLVVIWCLCFIVAVQVGYIIPIGAVSNGEVWPFFFGSTPSLSLGQDNGTGIRTRSSTTETIDNYYSRPHIREAVPLIVGGSDGSGTRAFVRILEQLDVPMLVEDRGTLDVHAKQLYNGAGWPALVIQVLNATRSASYDLKDLPAPLVESAREQVRGFLKAVNIAGRALVSAGTDKSWASSILWGFKAPVSILLLPFFREELPAMKVLHIVRDGRDTALSENHSPVQKFYPYFYADAAARNKAMLNDKSLNMDTRFNVKAMQLWNDWNKQVYDYGVRYSDGKSLDVLVMRTEDLMHYPLESVHLLADFVGSLRTPQQLCCLSLMAANDLGQSGSGGMDPFAPPGEEEGSRHEGPLIDPADFNDIRRRFTELHPDKSTDDAPSRRRLQSGNADGEEADRFKSGGKLASANHPRNDLSMNANDSHDSPGVVRGGKSPDLSAIVRMQQMLQERRAHEGNDYKQVQPPEAVKSRYGKWMRLLSSEPVLSDRFHREGGEALSLFGYEPPREFMDLFPHPELIPRCDSTSICPP